VRKEQIVSEVAQTLHDADFEVTRVVPYGYYCFDIAARKNLVLLLKILVNVDSMEPSQAEQLRRLCHLVSGYPLLIGDRTRTERIEDDVVHERYSLPAINPETLRMLIQNAALPLIFSTKGGYYVTIDGEALRAERERRGLSLGQLAEMVGVTRESIYTYERGGNATVETAMVLAQKLGVDLVSPVEVLRKIEMSLEPGGAVDSELVRYVAEKLTLLGFGVFTTPRTPFHLLARESEDRLLATAFERYRNLREHVDVISRLSRVVDITAFLVSQEKEGVGTLQGIPIIQENELAEIEKRSDLSGIIKEKRRA